MSMTAKDYDLIGSSLGEEVAFLHGTDAPEMAHFVQALAANLATRLEADNPKFDREKFMSLVHVKDVQVK